MAYYKDNTISRYISVADLEGGVRDVRPTPPPPPPPLKFAKQMLYNVN